MSFQTVEQIRAILKKYRGEVRVFAAIRIKANGKIWQGRTHKELWKKFGVTSEEADRGFTSPIFDFLTAEEIEKLDQRRLVRVW
jgi:hypothetical protein